MSTYSINDNQAIEFRNTFLSKVPNEQFTDNMYILVNKFNLLSPEEALRRLWNLTYTPATEASSLAILVNGYIYDENRIPFSIPSKLITPVRNELCYQYQQHSCSDFLELTIPENCEKQFKVFCSAIKDKIVQAFVAQRCIRFIKNNFDHEIEKAISLLHSKFENNYFGGLRRIHFNYDEATFLKPYAYLIGNLMESLAKEQKRVEEENIPFTFGDSTSETETHSSADNTLSIAVPLTVCLEDTVKEDSLPLEDGNILIVSGRHKLTPLQVLEHQELIEEFLDFHEMYQEYVSKLYSLGIDSKDVVAQSEAIGKLLLATLNLHCPPKKQT